MKLGDIVGTQSGPGYVEIQMRSGEKIYFQPRDDHFTITVSNLQGQELEVEACGPNRIEVELKSSNEKISPSSVTSGL